MITGSDWPGFKRLWPAFLSGVQNRWLLIFSILLALGGFGISLFQYLNLIAVDKISWIFWLASIALLFAAFLERGQIRRYPSKIRKQEIVLFALLTLVYFITRLFRFDVAPWNFFSGLFDDAAWDIYFANEYVTSGAHSFQVIFLDGFAGISRELLFHYYITAFFKLFGYNLFVFNISLLVLGYITVLFTALTVSKLLKSFSVGLLAGVLLNFLPFHVTQTFMGHRYAICPPLMMISLYYLTTAFQNKSFPRAVLGGVFAAFCLESAIMGKQYVYSLAGFVVLYTAFHWKKIVRGGGATYILLSGAAALSFAIAFLPLFSYILIYPKQYNMRESSLIHDFFARVSVSGIQPFIENARTIFQVFFAGYTGNRQFMPDYPLLPYAYWPLVIPGIILTFFHKRYDLFIMSLLPTAGNIFSICYDFRVMISAPIWIICAAYAMHAAAAIARAAALTGKPHVGKNVFKWIPLPVCVLLTAWGFFSSVQYLNILTSDPNHIYHLPHRSVAVSRLMQDLVEGAENPSISMKSDELNRNARASDLPFHSYAGTWGAYAHIHAYLQNYDAKKILSLFNDFPYASTPPEEITQSFIRVISEHQDVSKDLRIILETNEKIDFLLDALKSCEKYGAGRTIDSHCDGVAFSVYYLDVRKENLADFKSDILRRMPET